MSPVVLRGEAASLGWPPRPANYRVWGIAMKTPARLAGKEGFVGFKRERGFNFHLGPEVKRSQWLMTCKRGDYTRDTPRGTKGVLGVGTARF